ncbi:MAG: TetR/AcrR family transcriptional regulator [Pseudomonadota bacterium]
MSGPTKPNAMPWPEPASGSLDGRRQRSSRSRRQIIEALFALLHEGDMSPSAAAVAERANVGLRTVFRHFEDMDSIYNEMTQEIMTAVKPKITAPYEATRWRAQLMESIDKRADLYESIFPIKVCMSLRRFQSDFLAQQYAHDIRMERSALKAILPAEVAKDRVLLAALESALSFSNWRSLRQDQGLSVANAKASVELTLRSLTEKVDTD